MASNADISGLLSSLGKLGTSATDSLLGSIQKGSNALGFSSKSDVSAQLELMRRMAQPTKYGWSWDQYNQQLEYEQYVKELNASLQQSSATNLSYNLKLNKMLPTAIREGLEAAGYNPILAVLGQYSGQTGSISPSVGSTSRAMPNVSGRHGNSAVGQKLVQLASDYFTGSAWSQVANLRADTENKLALRDDIRASANLKNAEAANVLAKTKTEDSIREAAVKDKENTAKFGQGEAGSITRLMDTGIKNTIDLFDNAKATIKEAFVGKDGSDKTSASAVRSFNPDYFVSPSSAAHYRSVVDDMERRRIDEEKRRSSGWRNYFRRGWNQSKKNIRALLGR